MDIQEQRKNREEIIKLAEKRAERYKKGNTNTFLSGMAGLTLLLGLLALAVTGILPLVAPLLFLVVPLVVFTGVQLGRAAHNKSQSQAAEVAIDGIEKDQQRALNQQIRKELLEEFGKATPEEKAAIKEAYSKSSDVRKSFDSYGSHLYNARSAADETDKTKINHDFDLKDLTQERQKVLDLRQANHNNVLKYCNAKGEDDVACRPAALEAQIQKTHKDFADKAAKDSVTAQEKLEYTTRMNILQELKQAAR